MIQKLLLGLSTCFHILAKSPEKNLECFINIINTVLTEKNVYWKQQLLSGKCKILIHIIFLKIVFHCFYLWLTGEKSNQCGKWIKTIKVSLLMICRILCVFYVCFSNLFFSETGYLQTNFQVSKSFLWDLYG